MKVKLLYDLKIGSKLCKKGDEVEMEDAQARAMISGGYVNGAKVRKPAAPAAAPAAPAAHVAPAAAAKPEQKKGEK